jgi:hypothetical protein
MSRPFAWICLSITLASVLVAQKPPVQFAAPVAYGSGIGGAYGMAYADVNEDGTPDLVVGNLSNSTIGVMLGKPGGTFDPAVTYGSGGWAPISVAVADVNGDGHLDLVATNECVSIENSHCVGGGLVAVLIGNGNGTFQTAVTYDSGAYSAVSVAVADVNGDIKPDLVVANECVTKACDSGHGQVAVLLNKGDGTFKKAVVYDSGGFGARSVKGADLNGDGHVDLVVANLCVDFGNCNGGAAAVLMGNGDGTFQTAVTYAPGTNLASASLADVNGDGHLDLLVPNSVMLGNGNGTFQPPIAFNSGSSSTREVTATDVNGDGKVDLVAVNQTVTNQDVSILPGNGDGTFQPAITLNSGGGPAWSIIVSDVNGDGKPDLLVSNGNSNTVGEVLNTFLTPTVTAVTSSANPSHVGQAVTFTATVTGRSSVPDGTVITFYNGINVIGTAAAINSAASFTTAFSQTRTFHIKALFAGDAFHKPSSGKVPQVVTP